MGGFNEKVVSYISSKIDGKEIIQGARLRLHENRIEGKVHFHDDKNNLKVEVPISEFFKKWNDWKSKINSHLIFIDAQGQTKLSIYVVTSSEGILDVVASIDKVTFGMNFKAIDDFVQGK